MGMQEYPIWDESAREGLNTTIFNHFWTREIGCETPALFVWRLNTRMGEIMPKYNRLFPVLENLDITSTEKISENYNSEHNANSSGDSQTVSSDTPNGILDSVDPFSNTWASNAGYNKSAGKSSGKDTSSRSISGYHSSPLDAIEKYDSILTSVYPMICRDLENLFMGVW